MHTEIVRSFLKSTIQKELWEAVEQDNVALVHKWMEQMKPKETPTTGQDEDTICHVAASHGSLKVLKEFGPNLKEKHFVNKHRDTWLHVAFKSSQKEIARYILDNFKEQVEAHPLNDKSETVIDVAVSSAQAQVDATLKKRNTLLHTIASTGLTMLIDSLGSIEIGDFEVQNNLLETVLHTAAKGGHKNAVRELISLAESKTTENQLKKILNIQNKDGETVLHVVSRFFDLDTIRLLVDKGADLKIQDNCGNTSLHVMLTSAENQVDQLIKVMDSLDSFTDILQMQNDKGETVMHIVCKTCDIDCIELLVKKGASLATPDKNGKHTTPKFNICDIISLF